MYARPRLPAGRAGSARVQALMLLQARRSAAVLLRPRPRAGPSRLAVAAASACPSKPARRCRGRSEAVSHQPAGAVRPFKPARPLPRGCARAAPRRRGRQSAMRQRASCLCSPSAHCPSS